MVHIGETIKQTLKLRRKSVVWFAGELSCSRTNVYKIFSKPSIDTNDLLRISRILDCDFFDLYTKELRLPKGGQ
ncbi:MAG: helix-turn-helix domain-containing protein [Prevotella sp.]|nr:helix-turn-helix domain-containing protein [Prevotella sp.]